MRSDPARLLLAACSALTLAACGSVNGQHASTGSTTTPAQASPRGTLAPATCGPPPPRHAWAVDVTRTGRMLIVHGIRLADGHPLWSWPGGESVYGLWRWGGLVAVLTDQVSNHARLSGLAMAIIGKGLQVVNLADGRVRWQRRLAASPALTAVVPATGRVAWRFDPPTPATDPGAPASVLSAGPAGLAVATYDPRRLYLLDLRTGRPRWHADTFVAQGTLPLVTGTSVVLVEGQDHVTVVARDAVNGRVRWRDSVSGPSEGYQPVLAVGPLVILQGEPGAPGGTAPLLAYQAASGRLAWRAAMPTFVQAPPVLVAGGILVQPADPGYACASAG